MSTSCIGLPVDRVDGRAKVTGQAKYAAEYRTDELLHGCVVSSAIARGKIKSIDTDAALSVPGVIEVFTHENIPGLGKPPSSYSDDIAPAGWPFRPLHDAKIVYS